METFEQPSFDDIVKKYGSVLSDIGNIWTNEIIDFNKVEEPQHLIMRPLFVFRGYDESLSIKYAKLLRSTWDIIDIPIAYKQINTTPRKHYFMLNMFLHRCSYDPPVDVTPSLKLWGPKYDTEGRVELTHEYTIGESSQWNLGALNPDNLDCDQSYYYNLWLTGTAIEYSLHLLKIVYEHFPTADNRIH